MHIRLDLLPSLEILWWISLAGTLLGTRLTWTAVRGVRWQHVSQLHSREDGAAYTLSYVMAIPLLALLMCLMIETPLLLTAKLGTVYAGFSAARSAAVWSSATDWETAEAKAQWAALKAFAPFSSGTQSVFAGGTPDLAVALKYVLAYEMFGRFNGEAQSSIYLGKKIGYAARHLTIELEKPATWEADTVVKVAYEFPFNVPGIGRLLGERTPDGRFVYPLRTQVTMRTEAPQNDTQTLGIGYGTFTE